MTAHLPTEIIAAAQAAQTKWGIPAAISLAQFGVESDWGARLPLYSNDPFGMKALPGQPSVSARTREVINHQSVFITAQFRKFTSFAQAFDAHGALLALGRPYEAARALLAGGINTASVNAFANALTGVYATDPEYGATLIKVMVANDLYQYDDLPGALPVIPLTPQANIIVTATKAEPTPTAQPIAASAPTSAPQPLAKPTPQPVVTPVRVAATVGAVGVAVAGAGALTQMHGVDLTPIITPIISTAGLILSGFAAWALQRVAAYAHLSMQSALMQNLLGVVDRGITYGQNQATKLAAQDATVNVPTEAEAQALQYVVNKAPGTAKALGIDVTTLNGQQHIADLITAKLPST